MNRWDELFQGEVADEFNAMLAADFSDSLNLATDDKENTGNTCGRTCSCGPEDVCRQPPQEGKSEACGGSVVNTSCRTCGPTPEGCGDVKKAAGDEFLPRIPGWSTPPNHASL